MKYCVYCGSQVSEDDVFCSVCGAKQQNAKVDEASPSYSYELRCPYCETPVAKDDSFCTVCGAQLTKIEVEQPYVLQKVESEGSLPVEALTTDASPIDNSDSSADGNSVERALSANEIGLVETDTPHREVAGESDNRANICPKDEPDNKSKDKSSKGVIFVAIMAILLCVFGGVYFFGKYVIREDTIDWEGTYSYDASTEGFYNVYTITLKRVEKNLYEGEFRHEFLHGGTTYKITAQGDKEVLHARLYGGYSVDVRHPDEEGDPGSVKHLFIRYIEGRYYCDLDEGEVILQYNPYLEISTVKSENVTDDMDAVDADTLAIDDTQEEVTEMDPDKFYHCVITVEEISLNGYNAYEPDEDPIESTFKKGDEIFCSSMDDNYFYCGDEIRFEIPRSCGKLVFFSDDSPF